jgi:hypothetical protein
VNAPINAVTWTLGAVSLYIFAWKSWRSFKLTRNPVARMYVVIGLSFATALFFYGVPGLFTLNTHILRCTYFLADLFVQISMQAGLWLLWFLGLRNRFPLNRIFLVSIPFSAVLMTLQAMTSHVAVSTSPLLIIYTDETPVLILKSIIYVAMAAPLGYFFLRAAPGQSTLRAQIKSLVAGLFFIVVGIAAVSNNIFDKGSDTERSATVLAVFFVIFILVQLLRPSSSGQRGSGLRSN